TKAAEGFARGQGASVNELYERRVKDKEYVFVKKYIEGEPTYRLLGGLQQLITSMTFPKSMRWGANELRFIRPIRWLLVLYGNRVVPMSIAGTDSGRITHGHRFLGGPIEMEEPSAYKETLLGQFVIADPGERKAAIRDQLATLSEHEGWHIPVDEELLEEVNNLVEYPTALYGTFDEKFLRLPTEVLMTSMREHQRYFPVEDGNGELLPYFVTIRNGDHEHLETVARGNEKVLHARLSDARFFYEEDQKMTIDDALSRLERIVFQEKLGTMGDKAGRVRKLAKLIAEGLHMDEEATKNVDRAAEICKFDLVTYMVDEFSKLQGVMGEKYARIAGEPEKVAVAVNEHYRPRFKGDQLPKTVTGAIVGAADKLDTVAGCFIAGLIPTGSQDPYGLRRSASGIVQILLGRGWDLSLGMLIDRVLDVYEDAGLLENREDVLQALRGFFLSRLKTSLEERGIRYDVIDAVLTGDLGNVGYLVDKAELLAQKSTLPEFKSLVETLSRVTNIAAKAESSEGSVDPSIFEKEEEQQLYRAAETAQNELASAEKQRNPHRAYEALVSLQDPINRYFDEIMVMAKDSRLRANRLALLRTVSKVIRQFASFDALVL
ncbi:MAG TPA: glycine--tRNA ligase subunit beta, partial [Bacillales bacterium]|nr:glycine--tRNA ligase subunit beta [Bacillales bacterium]